MNKKMEILFSLNVAGSLACINIYIPSFESKINYFYTPTKKPHKFDEVTVIYEDSQMRIELSKDALIEVLSRLEGDISKVLENSLKIPSFVTPGDLGKMYNSYLYEDGDNFFGQDYGLFSYKNTETLIYNYKSKIFLEIAPLYHLFHKEDHAKEEIFCAFKSFLAAYKAYVVVELQNKDVQKWKKEISCWKKKIE